MVVLAGEAVPQGTVKRFNADKGYGFIAPDDGTADVCVHHSALEADGYRILQDNQRVEDTVTEGAKGPQAEKDHPIRGPRAPLRRPRGGVGWLQHYQGAPRRSSSQRLGAGQEGQPVTDGALAGGGFRQREVCLDVVAVAAAVLLLDHVAGLDQVRDDAEGAAFGDIQAG